MILKYDDLIFENMINETYVYYIKDFKDILYKLSTQSQIAKDLIDLEYRDVKNDMTFISLSDREGYISGSTLRSLKNNIEKSFTDWAKNYNLDDNRTKNILDTLIDRIEKGETSQSDVNHMFNEYDLKSKSRNDVKLGRLVNALLPGKYTSKDIEEFTNKFKAALSKRGEYFEEVTGDAINYWYNHENYLEMSGTLGNSCMARKSGLFDIYVQNPDVCKLLILVNDDKLIGRAIVWKLDTIKSRPEEIEPNWFMDRQYTINDSLVEKFRNYAKEKGWIIKSRNTHSNFESITFNDKEFRAKMTIKVEAKNYKKYPYMDTFKRFDPESGILYNDEDEDEEYEGQYLLNDTGGRYEEIESGLWSEWCGCRIPEDRAVWSDWADSYLWADRSIYVQRGSRRYRDSYYPEDCEDIVYSSWYDESIHINDAVYCEEYGDYILSDDAVQVIEDVDFDGKPSNWSDNWYHESDDNILKSYSYIKTKWYEILSDRWSSWSDCDYAKKDLFSKDYKDDYIIDIFSIIVYKVEGDLENIQWLSELDAEILGIKIGNEERLTDKFDYELSIENIRMSLKDKLRRKIKRIEDTLNDKGQLQFKFDEEETERYKTGIRSKLNPYKERLKEIERGTFYE